MTAQRKTVLLVVLLMVLLGASGCKKRRPRIAVTVPPEIPVETQVSQLPEEEETLPELEEPEPEPAAAVEPPKPRPRPRRPRRVTPAPAEPAAEANKKVIEEGSAAPGPVISAVIPDSKAAQTQQETASLITAAENNLNGIRRSLNSAERTMADQARNFIRQSQDATKNGDVLRAHNLAIKAHQLSSELAKN